MLNSLLQNYIINHYVSRILVLNFVNKSCIFLQEILKNFNNSCISVEFYGNFYIFVVS